MNEMTKVLGTVAMVPKGEWDEEAYYEKLNVVSYNGSSYVATKSSTGETPTNTNFWQLLARAALDIIYDEINEALYLTIVGNAVYNSQTEDLTFEII